MGTTTTYAGLIFEIETIMSAVGIPKSDICDTLPIISFYVLSNNNHEENIRMLNSIANMLLKGALTQEDFGTIFCEYFHAAPIEISRITGIPNFRTSQELQTGAVKTNDVLCKLIKSIYGNRS